MDDWPKVVPLFADIPGEFWEYFKAIPNARSKHRCSKGAANMSEKFRLDGHVYYASPKQFFRDATEITQAEFYNALFLRLKRLKILT